MQGYDVEAELMNAGYVDETEAGIARNDRRYYAHNVSLQPELLESIPELSTDSCPLCAALADLLRAELRKAGRECIGDKRRRRIYTAWTHGLTVREIARYVKCSPTTVIKDLQVAFQEVQTYPYLGLYSVLKEVFGLEGVIRLLRPRK